MNIHMKAIRTVGIVVLILWMAWISLEVERVKGIAIEACGIAWGRSLQPDGGLRLPVVCPDLGWNEAIQGSSR
jgi:hypothetical protein